MSKMAQIINLTSALVRRSQLAAVAGKTYSNDRDLYAQLGYKRDLDFIDYKERYARGGIAHRIVNTPSDTTWRNKPTIEAKDGNEEFAKAWEKFAKRLKVFHYLERADTLAGIGQYGVLFIGVGGGRATSERVKRVNSEKDILFLSTYTEGNAEIKSFEDNASNPRFGLPNLYRVNIAREGGLLGRLETKVSRTIEVHHSRLIHIADGASEDDIYGTPRLMPVWNYLDDLEKTVGASSESAWRTAVPHYQFNIDSDMELHSDDEDDFSDEIEELMHGLRRYIRTQGIDVKQLGGAVADPRGMFTVLASLISGTTGIPMRILFGSERGQLASTQDEKNYNARIKERQETYAEPVILRPFIDRMIAWGALPRPGGGEYEVKWPDLSTLTAREKADVGARVAQGIRNISTAIKEENSPITIDEFRRLFLDLGPLGEE